jgi:uncharacterized membrane-anchored protein
MTEGDEPMTRAHARVGVWREPLAVKVPEITALFWVIKLLTTGTGEAASDYLAGISVVLAGGLGFVGFVVAMVWQLRTDRYVTGVYWFAVAMIAVFGTMAADGLHVVLGIPYVVSTIFYAVVVAAILGLWYRSEGTLSIHSITTKRREMFYWITVLATFALGTAAGDLTAASMHLGYFWSTVLFTAVIAVPAIGWWRFGLNPILAFWFAYIVTRPVGASLADWFGKPPSKHHGLGYGDGTVTMIATLAIVGLVYYVARTRSDVQDPGADQHLARARVSESPNAER